MRRPSRVALTILAVVAAVALGASVVVSQTDTSGGAPPPPPPVRAIPGITAPDPHPQACVDCHVNMKQYNMDVRISTLMAKWTAGAVEPKLLAAAKAAAADPAKISGKHPKAAGALKDIPRACLGCHGAKATVAPPFSRMIHLIHLEGGDANLYLGYYQGDCTHCHKLDAKSGKWSIPSAAEPPGP